MNDPLQGLNDAQRQAVTATEGALLIVAGPGTGKTLTLVRRIARIISQGVDPGGVLAVTFTNRAAREMRERAASLIGEEAGKVFIGTFHSLGLSIVRELSSTDPVVYSRPDHVHLLKRVMKAPVREIEKTVERISRIKNLCAEPEEEMREICAAYEALLRKNGALDLDDLILRPLEMLADPEVMERYRARFRYIMVDEYQDINPAQYRLLRLLAGERGNLCAVGDADQAIYGFRGADLTNFLSFTTDFPESRTILLRENYRSTAAIVRASDGMIRCNRERLEKELAPTGAEGARISVISAPDERAGGEAIIGEIEQRIGGTSHFMMRSGSQRRDVHPSDSWAFSDFAVIYRTHSQARAIEEAFTQSGIPCRVLGSRTAAGTDAVPEILTLLRAIIHPGDALSLRRTAQLLKLPEQTLKEAAARAEARGTSLGEAMEELKTTDPGLRELLGRLSRIRELAQGKTAAEVIALAGKELGRGEHQELDALQNLAASYGDDISRFIAEMELLTPSDDYDPRADAVTLMTLHAAKGLEFRQVFITGCEDGLIPYTLGKECNEEEERRLFYVGMTRAKEELCLIHSRSRLIHGQRLSPQPSPFISEIPEELLHRISIPDRTRKEKKEKKEKKETQMGLFS